MTAHGWAPPGQGTLLVSDSEREQVASLLRQHWLAGRLSLEELDARLGAALSARNDGELFATLQGLPVSWGPPARPLPPPQSDGAAVTSLVLGVMGLTLLFISFGLLSIVTLPLSATAWGLGRSARQRGQGRAQAGEVLGIIGTILSALLLAGCAAVVL